MSTPLNGSILKAFSMLRLMTLERTEISATTVANELKMTHATAHRLLLTLEEAGAVVSMRRGVFSLGPLIEELGVVAKASNKLAARINPLIADLALALNESAMVCRLGRHGPTCIAVASSNHSISVNINVGTVLPMVGSAQGKLWLSEMDLAARAHWLQDGQALDEDGLTAIKSHGHARNRGESEPDIGAVSVPVRNEKGEIVLTLSTFGMVRRFDDEMVARNLPILMETAEKIQQLVMRAS